MSQVDQFESVFRSAVKDVYAYDTIKIKKVMVVTDLKRKDADLFLEKIKKFMSIIGDEIEWHVVIGKDFDSTEALYKLKERYHPDLFCAYRNLHSRAWRFPYSLGEYLDVLIQRTDVPVMILPHPEAGYEAERAFDSTQSVMAITDHLSNDHRLVNYAVGLTESNGQLYLMHIENQAHFNRIIDAISKIPTIDTDDAKEKLTHQLLKEPKDYIESCRKGLKEAGLSVSVTDIVEFGHHLKEYQKRIEELKINLLVMNSKDEDQLAMHSLAYPLAVELREIPLLML